MPTTPKAAVFGWWGAELIIRGGEVSMLVLII